MIEVVEPGALTSVQTADGRPGWRHLGVPVGGAADAWSARLANRLVDNADDAALLELTLHGPALRFQAATAVAITGARFDATLDGLPLPPFVGRPVPRFAAPHRRRRRCACATSRSAAGSTFRPCSGRRRRTCAPGSAGTRGGRCAPAIAWRSGPRPASCAVGRARDDGSDSDRAGTTSTASSTWTRW